MESLWLRETLCLFVDLMQTFCSDSQDSMLPQWRRNKAALMFNAAVSDERINLIVEAINGEGKVAKADYCNDTGEMNAQLQLGCTWTVFQLEFFGIKHLNLWSSNNKPDPPTTRLWVTRMQVSQKSNLENNFPGNALGIAKPVPNKQHLMILFLKSQIIEWKTIGGDNNRHSYLFFCVIFPPTW